MSTESDGLGPDLFLMRLLNSADPADRPALAQAFGAADHISRHLPAHALHQVIRVAWLQAVAVTAEEHGNPNAKALRWAADAAAAEAVNVMAVLVVQAPDDARELDG